MFKRAAETPRSRWLRNGQRTHRAGEMALTWLQSRFHDALFQRRQDWPRGEEAQGCRVLLLSCPWPPTWETTQSSRAFANPELRGGGASSRPPIGWGKRNKCLMQLSSYLDLGPEPPATMQHRNSQGCRTHGSADTGLPLLTGTWWSSPMSDRPMPAGSWGWAASGALFNVFLGGLGQLPRRPAVLPWTDRRPSPRYDSSGPRRQWQAVCPPGLGPGVIRQRLSGPSSSRCGCAWWCRKAGHMYIYVIQRE